MTELPDFPSLPKDQKLLSEVLAQLEKDLGESYSDLEPEQFQDINHLVEIVADILWEVHSKSQQTLFNLFYRIDLPESKIQNVLTSDGFDWNALAELILKRELQKVVLRRHFSK